MIREGACGLRGQSKFGVTNFISFPRKRVRSSPCVFILLSILLITNAVLPRESLDPTGAGPLEFLVSQVVVMAKSLLAKAGGTNDAGVIPGLGRSPGKGMTTHSIILACRIPWAEEPGGYSPWGCKESDTTEHRQTLFRYKYFEVIHSIFRLFMAQCCHLFMVIYVWFLLFFFLLNLCGLFQRQCGGDSYFSSHLGTIQKSFPSIS